LSNRTLSLDERLHNYLLGKSLREPAALAALRAETAAPDPSRRPDCRGQHPRGAVADPGVRAADTLAIREFNDQLLADQRVDLSLLPLGDGLTLARRRN
jgi:predicted O-methyltransferase YrrM